MHGEGRPRCSSDHVDELFERLGSEATPATAGRRQILPVEIPPDVFKGRLITMHNS